jgi:Rrf2 family protein
MHDKSSTSPELNRMWLSSTAQQAIHAVLCVARGGGAALRVEGIAAETGLPRNYLSKTLHTLSRAGVLSSERGPRGGFRLAHAPERLTLARVIAPFSRPGRRCLLGRPTCGDRNPCPAHSRWGEIAASIEDYFSTTTIATLLENSQPETRKHCRP